MPAVASKTLKARHLTSSEAFGLWIGVEPWFFRRFGAERLVKR